MCILCSVFVVFLWCVFCAMCLLFCCDVYFVQCVCCFLVMCILGSVFVVFLWCIFFAVCLLFSCDVYFLQCVCCFLVMCILCDFSYLLSQRIRYTLSKDIAEDIEAGLKLFLGKKWKVKSVLLFFMLAALRVIFVKKLLKTLNTYQFLFDNPFIVAVVIY